MLNNTPIIQFIYQDFYFKFKSLYDGNDNTVDGEIIIKNSSLDPKEDSVSFECIAEFSLSSKAFIMNGSAYINLKWKLDGELKINDIESDKIFQHMNKISTQTCQSKLKEFLNNTAFNVKI